jgi:signal transduction histidine kinase
MTTPSNMSRQWILGWRLLAGAAFVVVGFSVAFSAPEGWPDAAHFWALFGALVIWYVGIQSLGRARLVASLPWSYGFYLLGLVIWALILPLHPAAYAFAAFMFPVTYSLLSIRYSIPSGIALSGIMLLAGNGWRVRVGPGDILAILLAVASSVMLALFIHSIIRQSIERKRLIDELESTRASLAAAERQAGIQAERQRLAQQIHDTVAQGFVGIVTHLEAAEAAPGGADPGIAGHVAEAKALARESLEASRRLVWDLRPDLRDGAPLTVVLERQLAEWSARSGVRGRHVLTGTARELDPNRETAILQAAREALNNVKTHAGASHVTVTLSYMEDEVALDVRDDGAGIGSGRPAGGGGFGLKALDERVRGLGGRLILESQPGEGTTLTVSLPVESGA